MSTIQMIVRLPTEDSRGFKSVCSKRGISMAEVIRKVAEKVGRGDTALLDRICK